MGQNPVEQTDPEGLAFEDDLAGVIQRGTGTDPRNWNRPIDQYLECLRGSMFTDLIVDTGIGAGAQWAANYEGTAFIGGGGWIFAGAGAVAAFDAFSIYSTVDCISKKRQKSQPPPKPKPQPKPKEPCPPPWTPTAFPGMSSPNPPPCHWEGGHVVCQGGYGGWSSL